MLEAEASTGREERLPPPFADFGSADWMVDADCVANNITRERYNRSGLTSKSHSIV